MKTVFKINPACPDSWKTAGSISIPGKNGGRYTRAVKMSMGKALKIVRESLKLQGRAFTETTDENGFFVITAE